MNNKKFFDVINVGGKKIIRKPKSNKQKNLSELNSVIEKNKRMITKCTVDDFCLEKGKKVYRYKGSSIKLLMSDEGKPIGFLVSGLPEIKNKVYTDIPTDFEAEVKMLNKDGFEKPISELDIALDID